MTSAVLDASAVIALLKGERGSSKVAKVIADAAVGVFNQAEIVSHFVHVGAPLDEIRTMLGALPYGVVEADEALGWEAGALQSITARAGLSLGDRFCLALAKRLGVPAYTGDAALREVGIEAGVKVVMIR